MEDPARPCTGSTVAMVIRRYVELSTGHIKKSVNEAAINRSVLAKASFKDQDTLYKILEAFVILKKTVFTILRRKNLD